MNDEDSGTFRLFEENLARTLRDTEDAARTKMSLDSKFWSSRSMDTKFMESHKKGKGPARYPGLSGIASSSAEEHQLGELVSTRKLSTKFMCLSLSAFTKPQCRPDRQT